MRFQLIASTEIRAYFGIYFAKDFVQDFYRGILMQAKPVSGDAETVRFGECPPIHATIRVVVPADKRTEVMGILKPILEQTRLEPGCVSCRLYRDIADENALLLEQEWGCESDLQRHLRSRRFHTVLLVVEMASEPPEIRFDTVPHSKGIDVIERLRG
jgi:quinol monooxygenase YgiN